MEHQRSASESAHAWRAHIVTLVGMCKREGGCERRASCNCVHESMIKLRPVRIKALVGSSPSMWGVSAMHTLVA